MLWACENDTSNVAPTTNQGDILTAVSAHKADFDKAITIHNRYIPEILAERGVAGTAISADDKGMPVITIYTKEQTPPGQLKKDYEGVRVIEQVSGAIKPFKSSGGGTSGQAKQTPPVKMGTSGGWRYDLGNAGLVLRSGAGGFDGLPHRWSLIVVEAGELAAARERLGVDFEEAHFFGAAGLLLTVAGAGLFLTGPS